MQGVVKGAIELTGVGALKHHRQVLAVNPVRLRTQLLPDAVMEPSTWKRIGHGNAKIVRARLPYHLDGLFNVAPGFAGVAKLQEVARANSILPQTLARSGDLFNP